jgi:hypothetical protein
LPKGEQGSGIGSSVQRLVVLDTAQGKGRSSADINLPKVGTEVFLGGWHRKALQPPVIGERTNMLTLSAMIYNTARLGFEAQNAMAFRFLRLAARAAKSATPPVSLLPPPVPFLSDAELDDSPSVRAPAPVAHARRASERKPIKKTAHHQKGSKKRAASRR